MTWPFSRRRRPTAEEPAPLRLGLALGGGAVRGAAHVGVLSVFEREAIRPDVVSGTSVGSIVGASLAAGIPAEEMLEHFRAARWKSLTRPSWGSWLGLLDADPMASLVERVCGVVSIEELDMPFAAVACDVLTGERHVFTSGPLRDALVASSAIPGLFEPLRKDGMLLVDGGIVDNVPVDEAFALGATKVVAVDLMPPLHGEYRPKDIRDMLMLSANIMEQPAATWRGRADVLIMPDVASVSFSDFSQVSDAYEAGVRAAEEALPRLRELLGAGVGADETVGTPAGAAARR